MPGARPKLFSRTILKLTLIYTAIIFSISLAFSVVIGFIVIRGTEHPPKKAPITLTLSDDERTDFDQVFRIHNQQIVEDVLANLIVLNFCVLFLALAASYLLARRSLKPIEKVMNEQTDFIANASHELKTPLAVIQTENEVFLREKNPTKSDFREKLADNLREIQKLRKLTDLMLAMNASDSASVNFRECDLDEIVNDAYQRILRRARAKKITISRKITPEVITTVPENLTEIIFILLDNAVKYSPENSRIILTANSRKISIEDEGGGIPDEDISRIFERFYRSEKSHTGEGFGLGLSLAKNLAEKIRVKISAENVVKNGEKIGAKFVVKL